MRRGARLASESFEQHVRIRPADRSGRARRACALRQTPWARPAGVIEPKRSSQGPEIADRCRVDPPSIATDVQCRRQVDDRPRSSPAASVAMAARAPTRAHEATVAAIRIAVSVTRGCARRGQAHAPETSGQHPRAASARIAAAELRTNHGRASRGDKICTFDPGNWEKRARRSSERVSIARAARSRPALPNRRRRSTSPFPRR
jgi:hypothetical protein